MEIVIRTGKTRTVSTRELSRRTAELMNEIDDEGHALVIVRFGRAVALLVPLERKPRAMRVVTVEEREEEPVVMPELDDLQRSLLLRISACHPEPHRTSTWTGDIVPFLRSVGFLSLEGLIESDGARQYLTANGERVVAKLSA